MSAYSFSDSIRRQALAIRVAMAKFDVEKLPTEAHKELAELLSGELPSQAIRMLNLHLFDAEKISPDQLSPVVPSTDGLPLASSLSVIKDIDPVIEIFARLGLKKEAIAISGLDSVKAIRSSLGKVKDVSALLDAIKLQINNHPEFNSSNTFEYTLMDALENNRNNFTMYPFQMHSIISRIKGTVPFGDHGFKLRKARGPKDIAAIIDMTANDFEKLSPLNYHKFKGKPLEETVKYRRYAAESAVKAGTTFVILNEMSEICGTVGYLPTNTNGSSAELSWFIVPEHRGKGLATEAAVALLKKLIDNGFEHFSAHCMVSNEASKNVMNRLGFIEVDDHVATGADFDWIDMSVSKERFLEIREQTGFTPKL